jgi:hypothetical protein
MGRFLDPAENARGCLRIVLALFLLCIAGCGAILLARDCGGHAALAPAPPTDPSLGKLYAWPGEAEAFGWLTREELEQAQSSRGGGTLPPNEMRAPNGTPVKIVERDGQALEVVLGAGAFVRQRAWVDARDVR